MERSRSLRPDGGWGAPEKKWVGVFRTALLRAVCGRMGGGQRADREERDRWQRRRRCEGEEELAQRQRRTRPMAAMAARQMTANSERWRGWNSVSKQRVSPGDLDTVGASLSILLVQGGCMDPDEA
mmetsp:Transcript_42709/g.118221  ORF Transcript_42709/g.118221 Transcript_42709/m.118221 type:complete len:126 (+) Transcript_42709:151-528(+)